MALPNLLSAYADYVADAVQDATTEQPDEVIRYHAGATPEDCCTRNGILSVWASAIAPTTDFPSTLPTKGAMNGAYPLVTLGAKWVTCWNVPKLNEDTGAVITEYETWDEDAARLALVGETVSLALMRLSCQPLSGPAAEVLGAVGCEAVRFLDASPSIGGGCAGWMWRVYAGLSGASVS